MNTEVYLDFDGEEYECVVFYGYQHYIPEVCHLPPEDCYEEQPEKFELFSLKVWEGDRLIDISGVMPFYEDAIVNQLKAYKDLCDAEKKV